MLEGVMVLRMKEVRSGRVGFSSFCLLCITAVCLVSFAHRPEMYCFEPNVDNWARHYLRACLLVEVGSVLIALGALMIDKARLFAMLTLASFPLFLIIEALAMGCN